MKCGCVICQDCFDAAVVIVSTKCGHVFHNNCIHQWLEQSNSCPECRGEVDRNSLTKLFFNLSFDCASNKNLERCVDALKEQLRAKDSVIEEKDKKIKEIQTYCSLSEANAEKMHQEQLDLQFQLSNLKRDLLRFSRVESKNLKLTQQIDILQSELEHLNNVKTIVEGCSNDAKQILKDVQAQVSSEDGKVAINRIATYCSVIKRELCRLKDEKTQLQKEVTQLKCRMGLLRADNDKKIRNMEEQIKKLNDLNSSSIHVSPGSSSMSVTPNIPKYGSSGCSQNKNSASVGLTTSPSGRKQVTPITVDFTETKRQKLNVVILDKERRKVFVKAPETPASRMAKSVFPAASKFRNGESISRIGYNGLGGHGCFIMGSGKRKI